MAEKKPTLTEVQVAVGIPWERTDPVDVVKRFSDADDDIGTYDDWACGAAWALKLADSADLGTVTILFVHGGDITEVQAYVPDLSKGERLAVDPVVELEFHFNRKGYDTQGIGRGMYVVERPDSSLVTDKKRGYFDVPGLLALATKSSSEIDMALRASFQQHLKTSKYASFITIPTRGGGSRMAESKEKKAQVTAKGRDGQDVVISPKQQEVLAAIKAAPTSAPYGSGETRLPDPESIAAMKLATAGVVHRAKIGTRWHYFAKEGDAKKAEQAQEKAAQAAAAEKNKKAEERASKAASKSAPAASKAPAGKAKSGPLKKPSEK